MSTDTQNFTTSKVSNADLWDGEKYHKNSDQPKMVAELLLNQYAFNSNDNILDIGCGDGKITDLIATKVPQGKVIGLDCSQSMIDFARNNFEKPNVQFHVGMASEIPYESQFECITSFNCLHWEPNQKKALLCFRKALKPGGAIILAIPGPDLLLRSTLEKVCRSSKWHEYFINYKSPGIIWTANEYAALLLTTQFTIRKIESVFRPYLFPNEARYRTFVEAMLPHLSCLSKSLHQQFLHDTVEEIKKQGNIDEYGRMKFEVRVLEIIAFSPK